MQEAQNRRLTRFNYINLTLILLMLMAWVADRQFTNFQTDLNRRIERVRVIWEADSSLSFYSSSDGPFIINALILRSDRRDSIAQLPKPVIIIESGAVGLTKQEVGSLIWYERHDRERVGAPVPGASVQALYYKALKTDSVG